MVASSWASKGLQGIIPALFTRMVTVPTSLFTFSPSSRTFSKEETSHLKTTLQIDIIKIEIG